MNLILLLPALADKLLVLLFAQCMGDCDVTEDSGNIKIPYNFTPRAYQIPVYNCLPDGYKRGVVIWHRRAGKDKDFINILAREAFKRVGTYFYILPYYKQARLIIWEGADSSGFRFIDHFPKTIVKRQENQQMVLELTNGSIVRMLGSDNIDAIVGTNPIGVIFSEFSLHKPAAWNYLRPILLENKGWALFNGTPRGKNALWKMYQYAKKDPGWFSELLTINHTRKPDGTPVITEEDIEIERQSGMPEELIQQEYYCSFEAGLVGSILGDLMADASKEKRIGRFPWDPNLPVTTAWDLGFDDTNTIWFAQFAGREIRLIDCISDNRKNAGYYINEINKKPYTYEEHFFPHDVEVHEYSTGKTRRETFEDLGLKNIVTVPRMAVADKYGVSEGHNIMRQTIPVCYFDEEHCEDGIEGLKSYRREWDERHEKFGDSPVKDWAKHFADSFRQLCAGVGMRIEMAEMPLTALQRYDELRFTEERNLHYNPLDDYLEERPYNANYM